MFYLMMAIRNIQRNRRRSFLAIISVTLTLAFVMFISGLIEGMMRSVIKNSTKNETGHILITTEGFQAKKRFMLVNEYLKDPEKIKKVLMQDPILAKKIEDFNERILFGVLLQYEGRNKSVMAIAGAPEKEKKYLMLNRAVSEGEYLSSESSGKEKEILIGKKIADTLKLQVGDRMSVLIQGADDKPHISSLKVKGIFSTGLNMMDDRIFQMNIEDARKILGMGKGAHEIQIFLKNYREANEVANRIQEVLKKNDLTGLAVLSWAQAGGYAQTLAEVSGIYNLIYFIVALLGAIIIANIMTMVVMERRKEIGILKSMGFSKWEVVFLFFSEGTILGVIGSLSGVILGFVLSLYFVFNGLDFSASLGQMNVPMDSVIYVVFSVSGVLSVLLIGILVASLVSVFPAYRAGKMNVVESIKGV